MNFALENSKLNWPDPCRLTFMKMMKVVHRAALFRLHLLQMMRST